VGYISVQYTNNNIQKSQNHGNAVSDNYKNVMEAVNENFAWRGMLLRNA